MRGFYLDRLVDVSGSSGVGVVAEGVEFSDGTCVLRWDAATNVYPDVDAIERIHGHNGSTVIRWFGFGLTGAVEAP